MKLQVVVSVLQAVQLYWDGFQFLVLFLHSLRSHWQLVTSFTKSSGIAKISDTADEFALRQPYLGALIFDNGLASLQSGASALFMSK